MGNLKHDTSWKLCVLDPGTPISIKPHNVKPTDAKNPLHQLKSHGVTVNTWQIEGQWWNQKSLRHNTDGCSHAQACELVHPLGRTTGQNMVNLLTHVLWPRDPTLRNYPETDLRTCTRGYGGWPRGIVGSITRTESSVNVQYQNSYITQSTFM